MEVNLLFNLCLLGFKLPTKLPFDSIFDYLNVNFFCLIYIYLKLKAHKTKKNFNLESHLFLAEYQKGCHHEN